MDCGWPLCLVASPDILQQYNSMLVLLMQVTTSYSVCYHSGHSPIFLQWG